MRCAGASAGFLLLALVSAAHAQTTSRELALGVAAADSFDPVAARRHFEAVLAEDSLNYEANWRAALVLIDIAKRYPDRGKHRTRDSAYGLAEDYARRAVAVKPNNPDGHFALANAVGRASLTRGTKDRIKLAKEIRTEALKTIELDSTHDGAYHILGRWHAELMRVSGVQRFFAKNFLGADLFNQASWTEAIANLEKAVKLDPRRIYHRIGLADVYIHRKRYADARAQLETVPGLPDRDVMDSTYRKEAAETLRQIADQRDKS